MGNQTVRTLLVMIGLIVALLITTPSSAQLVWQDDFEDRNLEGWTVSYGDFTAENGTLTFEDPLGMGRVYHPSTGAYGSWSFDIFGKFWNVKFIATSANGYGFGTPNTSGYGFGTKLDRFGPGFEFHKILNGSAETIGKYDADIPDDWYHVNITRNTEGHFEVYVDRDLVMQETDASVMTSSFFIFRASVNGIAIDNIEVVTERYTPEYPIELIIGIPATVVVLLVLVGFRYRRQVTVIDG
ncbi:MAG: hypothetical protein ACXACG_00685 [Candidatus Thorarchaeota archaeon]